jgi:hypothetical protein
MANRAERALVRQRHFHRLAQPVGISKAQIYYRLCFLVKVALSSWSANLASAGCINQHDNSGGDCLGISNRADTLAGLGFDAQSIRSYID